MGIGILRSNKVSATTRLGGAIPPDILRINSSAGRAMSKILSQRLTLKTELGTVAKGFFGLTPKELHDVPGRAALPEMSVNMYRAHQAVKKKGLNVQMLFITVNHKNLLYRGVAKVQKIILEERAGLFTTEVVLETVLSRALFIKDTRSSNRLKTRIHFPGVRP